MSHKSDRTDSGGISRRALLSGGAGLFALPSAASLAAIQTTKPASPRIGKLSPHFKCTEFVRRRAGLSVDAMIKHWREIRAPLLRQIPGLVKFTFNTVDPRRSPDTYDAAVELWFEDAAAYDAAFTGERAELTHRLSEDAKLWMQSDFLGLFTRETIIRELPPQARRPGAKRLGLIGRPPGTTPEEYLRAWRDDHAPEVDRQQGLVRYTLNSAERRLPSSAWDGYAELSWTDWDTFEESARVIRKKNEYAQRASFFHSHLLLLVDEQPME
jgi:uncharacterized protein (TIGR02118 family)